MDKINLGQVEKQIYNQNSPFINLEENSTNSKLEMLDC